jgi:hypothetical protein
MSTTCSLLLRRVPPLIFRGDETGAARTSSAPRFLWTVIWGTMPLHDGGVHVTIENGARPLLRSEEGGCGTAAAAR